jgi:hypothetical protein
MNNLSSLVNLTVNVYVDGKLANQPAVPTEEKPAESDPVAIVEPPLEMPKDSSITATLKQEEEQKKEK